MCVAPTEPSSQPVWQYKLKSIHLQSGQLMGKNALETEMYCAVYNMADQIKLNALDLNSKINTAVLGLT